MKINTNRFFSVLFIIVLLSQLYIFSFKLNIVLQLLVLGVYFFFQRPTVSLTLLKSIFPFIIIFLIGFVGMLFNENSIYNIVKDISHAIKPILGLLIGYLFFKTINDINVFVKMIIYSGFISSIFHLIQVVTIGELFSGNLNQIRDFTRDNFLELFALFFLLSHKNSFNMLKLFDNKFKYYFILLILIVSNVLYFSRTMIIVAIIIFISVKGYTKVNSKSLKVIGVLFLVISLFYTYLFLNKFDRNKPGLESFLYKLQVAPAEIFKTKINRENHKDLWDHWRGYEAKRAISLLEKKPENLFFGMGYGSLVNLKFFAPLTGDYKDKGLKYISELHNGYVYIFYKYGVLGIIIYVIILINWYKKIYLNNNIIYRLISAIGLIYIFTSLIITGVYNSRDIIIFLLGALIYFSHGVNSSKSVKFSN